MNDLTNKTALVTGGGTGIGAGIALALAAEGCRVAICGRREEMLQRTVESSKGPNSMHRKTCDVSNRDDVGSLFAWVETELGPLDILVNSAGINVAKRMMADVDPAEFDRVVGVNLTGTFNCLHTVLPGMRKRQSGLIINIVSIAGKRALTLAGVPYCASKFGQDALGTYVNLEDSQNGVRVTNIYPGEVNTPIIDHRPSPPSAEKRAQMLQPEDIAACVMTIAKLPARAVVSELVITPPYQAGMI